MHEIRQRYRSEAPMTFFWTIQKIFGEAENFRALCLGFYDKVPVSNPFSKI